MSKFLVSIVTHVLKLLQYARDKDGVEYPSAHNFYHWSNTHDPDQDGFHNLYHQDFIYALSQVAHHKLSRHQLDPYQCTAFQYGIIHCNVGEEEANPVLEMAMEYAGALTGGRGGVTQGVN